MDSSLDLSKPLDSAMKNPNNQDMPLIDLSIFAPQKIHSNILPASLCKKLGAFVYKIDEQALYVVLQNPNDTHTKLLITRQLIHLAKPIVFCVESSFCFAWILRALIFIEGFYAQLDIGAMLEFLLQEAIALEASDIHIETKADYASVRFRIDGRLREIGRIELEDFSKLTTKLKLATSLDITESRLPQDGRMQKVLGGVEYDFRLSFVPLFGGESIVIRILYKHIQHITLDTLGLDEVVCTHLRRAIMHKNGLILVVGPTGSGKSTTLYALLEEIKTSQKKIITKVVKSDNRKIFDGINYILNQNRQVYIVAPLIDYSENKRYSIDALSAKYILKCPLLYNEQDIFPENALFVGDILSSGYFGAELCEIEQDENVAVIGAGPVGLCAMICSKLFTNGKIIAIDIDQYRLEYAKRIGIADYIVNPLRESVKLFVNNVTSGHGADKVIEAAGTKESFQISWEIARANAIIAIVAMYEENLTLPLPAMYGKNLTFKTGGVDAIHCKKLLDLISKGKISTEFLISKTFALDNILEAYDYFENRRGNCFKVAIKH